MHPLHGMPCAIKWKKFFKDSAPHEKICEKGREKVYREHTWMYAHASCLRT